MINQLYEEDLKEEEQHKMLKQFSNESIITTINNMLIDFQNIHSDLQSKIEKCNLSKEIIKQKCKKQFG